MNKLFGFHKVTIEDTIEAETAQELSDKMDSQIRSEGLDPNDFDCKSYWCEKCNCYHHISTYPCG